MTGADVIEIVDLITCAGIPVHVDGGWAVDALIGHQTREHGDVDIAVPHSFVPLLRQKLASIGFGEIQRDDSWECNFVLADDRGREVDVHSYTFSGSSEIAEGVPYPAASLSGSGLIAGRSIACISLEYVVEFHTGYNLRPIDYRDMAQIAAHFDLALPEEYRDEKP